MFVRSCTLVLGTFIFIEQTPTSGSPRDIHHLSIHLPDTDRTGESPPLQSPDHYPSSTISPQLSPFTPTTPSRQGGNHSTLDGEEEDRGEGYGKEERPIQSQLGAEFKSFEELVELQIKADDRTVCMFHNAYFGQGFIHLTYLTSCLGGCFIKSL